MGILSAQAIKKEIDNGNIIIEPFNPEQLNPTSYDIRLGPNYYINRKTQGPPKYNPFNPEHQHLYWGNPINATFMADDTYLNKLGIQPNSQIIEIQPGETILAHSMETIGSINNITTSLIGKSTAGRGGVTVTNTAGWGDPGFVNKWTMQITNHNNKPIVLAVGQRIAQIIFHRVEGEYVEYSGQYNSKDEWTPRDMLPKIKK